VCDVACVAQLTFAVEQLFGSGSTEPHRPAATSSSAAAAAAAAATATLGATSESAAASAWKPQALKSTQPSLICMQQLNKSSFNSISASVALSGPPGAY